MPKAKQNFSKEQKYRIQGVKNMIKELLKGTKEINQKKRALEKEKQLEDINMENKTLKEENKKIEDKY